LQDLFVSPGARGAGVGRRLIEYVYELARGAGCARVHWLTHESNTDAMLLYDRIAERSGFVQYRRAIK
jgi:GNAT superfamily N-acetyltransferase